ncbi:MAG: hypothetical protein U1E58_15620 [Tabrizicola sp.]
MSIITSIRPPMPVTESIQPTSDLRAGIAAGRGNAAPVADTTLSLVVQHPASKPPSADAHLLSARMTAETSAAAAAEAARDAYIKASIAAGISPLPLP